MKKIKISKFLDKLLSDYSFRRKIRFFLILGIGSTLIFGGFVIYASISFLNYVANLGQKINFSQATKNIPIISNVACRDMAKDLINIRIWVENPPMTNLLKLKQVCLDGKSVICESKDCKDPRQLETSKGEII